MGTLSCTSAPSAVVVVIVLFACLFACLFASFDVNVMFGSWCDVDVE